MSQLADFIYTPGLYNKSLEEFLKLYPVFISKCHPQDSEPDEYLFTRLEEGAVYPRDRWCIMDLKYTTNNGVIHRSDYVLIFGASSLTATISREHRAPESRSCISLEDPGPPTPLTSGIDGSSLERNIYVIRDGYLPIFTEATFINHVNENGGKYDFRNSPF